MFSKKKKKISKSEAEHFDRLPTMKTLLMLAIHEITRQQSPMLNSTINLHVFLYGEGTILSGMLKSNIHLQVQQARSQRGSVDGNLYYFGLFGAFQGVNEAETHAAQLFGVQMLHVLGGCLSNQADFLFSYCFPETSLISLRCFLC